MSPSLRLPCVESRSGAVARKCSVSRSRSSNRTGRFPASGFRTRVPALLHTVKPGFAFARRSYCWTRLAVTAADFGDPNVIGFPVRRVEKQPNGLWKRYLDTYGDRSVEVDALPAPELRERVADAIKLHLDPMEYQRLQTVEAAERDLLFKRLRRL